MDIFGTWKWQTKKLHKTFTKAKPFPHIQIPHFLHSDFTVDLLQSLQKEQFFPKESDLFKFHQTNDFARTEIQLISFLRKQLLSKNFLNNLEKITGTKLRKKIDLHGTLYRDTDFLLCHDDKLQGRKIAFMLYLTSLKKRDGGALELYSAKTGQPKKVIKSYFPLTNSFLCFKVKKHSFHQVSEVVSKSPRITIAGWFYGK